ncbi:MAG TPA: hypothetical protein VFG07_09310 [Thermoplasmata archaeon]|nr:hypothetical protein [Thermoplasmata archaeon]
MASAATQGGIALAVIGVLLLIVGGGGYAACTQDLASTTGSCGAILIVAVLGLVLLILGILVAVSASRSYTYLAPPVNPAVPPPLVTPVVIEQSVVRVRCRFCGTLGDPSSGRCAACGAPL